MTGSWVRLDRPSSMQHWKVDGFGLCGQVLPRGETIEADGDDAPSRKCLLCLKYKAHIPPRRRFFRRTYEADSIWEASRWHVTEPSKPLSLVGVCGYKVKPPVILKGEYEARDETPTSDMCLSCRRIAEQTRPEYLEQRVADLETILASARQTVAEVRAELRTLRREQAALSGPDLDPS